MLDGARRRGIFRRTHASAIRAVERSEKVLAIDLLSIAFSSSMIVVKKNSKRLFYRWQIKEWLKGYEIRPLKRK
jgi:hypothetical protein